MRGIKFFLLGLFILLVAGHVVSAAETTDDINIDVKSFQLENGMLFLVVERAATPQVAVRLAIRAGSALEENGRTGIAHLLEHMMFKGTKNFGTLNYQKDMNLQAQIEAAYQVVLREQRKRDPDQDLIDEKLKEMEGLRREVQKIFVPQAFSSQLGKNGAVGVNAFTTKNQTQYIASVPSDMLEQWFSIISEQLFEPAWREFYVEKEVIQREWAFRYVNDAGGAAWLDLNATAYTAHPYRNPTIGWKADMEKYSTQDAIAFHQRYYNPSNTVCVLVGDLTLETARRLAQIYFARYPSGERAPEYVTTEPEQLGTRKSIRYLKGARTPLVRIGFHGARMNSDDFYALDALTMILSHGRSARMTQNIINKGLAVKAWSYNPDNRYGGMVILGGSPNEPEIIKQEGVSDEAKRQAYLTACEQLEAVLLAEVDKMKTELVSERDLQRIKKLNQRDFIDRMRSNESLAGTLATLEVQAGWRYLLTYLDRLNAVTAADIQRVAKTYIRTDNKTSVYVIPGGPPEHPPENYTEVRSISGSAAASATHAEDLNNHSIYPTPNGWKHPLSFQRQPQKIEYPKAEALSVAGTQVFYLSDTELPLIDLTLLVKAGAVDVDSSKIGLSSVLNRSIIRGGTERYSPSEIALVLDENAIRLSLNMREEETVIHLSVLKNDWKFGLELLTDILTHSRFEPQIFDIAKMQEITRLQRQGGDARAVARRELEIWHFKNHPYGRDPLMGLQTIPTITSEDLKTFMAKYFVPANMVGAIAGDIDKKEVIAGLNEFFQALTKRPAPIRRLEDPKETPPTVTLIHKPGQVQSQVTLSLPSVKRTHPDFWKISLLMNILGGGDSLMFKRLRHDLGLVYSAGFYQTYKWSAGTLLGYIGCKGDKTVAAINETIAIVKALRQQVPDKELQQKRLDALNSFVFNVDTKSDLVEVYGRYHLRQEPLDTLEKIQDAFFNVSRDDLNRIAQKYLDLQKIQIVVVGDKLIKLKNDAGEEITLEEDLKNLARSLGVPYREIELR